MKNKFSGGEGKEVLRQRWEMVKDWWLIRKHKKLILAGGLCGVFLLVILINLICPGGKIWYRLSVQDTFNTYKLKKGQYCMKAMDPESSIIEATVCYESSSYQVDKLFDDINFILYGEVEKIKEYVIKGDDMREEKKVKPVPYYCHVVTVRIKRGIYGGVHRNQRVNLLCKWKYNARETDIKVGREVLFLAGGDVAKIKDRESGESIYILGQVRNRLGSYLVETEDYKGLGELSSKKDVISCYKKYGLLCEDE